MKHFSPLWSLIPGAALIAGCGSQPKDKTSALTMNTSSPLPSTAFPASL